jgi:hypothetical protein
MDSPTLPPIPDLATIAAVIRLAEAAEAERYEQWSAARRCYSCDESDLSPRPRPARDALVDFLRGQPEEVVAGLYGLYRLGDHPHAAPDEAAEIYRSAFDVAMLPIHAIHGASDLAAKGPLADGLRRGLEHLGPRLEVDKDSESRDAVPTTPEKTSP